jgi:hypothetical protein
MRRVVEDRPPQKLADLSFLNVILGVTITGLVMMVVRLWFPISKIIRFIYPG